MAPIPHDGATEPHHVIDDLDTRLHVVNVGSIARSAGRLRRGH